MRVGVWAVLHLRYDDLVRVAQQSMSSWGEDRKRREARMKADLDQDEQGKAEAEKLVPAADETLRPKDKYGRASASVVVCMALPLRTVQPRRDLRVQLRKWTQFSAKNSSGASKAGRTQLKLHPRCYWTEP